ncbi:leucine rich repeat family protein [Anaeramoeba flamelloides]|uniref:Leucine rich repeat family protein n=1 Tax=Anaeramoeba flamelloides TaxID=1746091 RepID=A0ABQ8YJD0_9EUKA|nr:leucine rich repeat family protein [Anaeramoeba flamelloides]
MQRLILNDQDLTHLDLSYNEIGSKAMEVLSEALKVNQALTELVFSENRIGDKEMQALSESLKRKPSPDQLGSF